jgi:hypothetical protein
VLIVALQGGYEIDGVPFHTGNTYSPCRVTTYEGASIVKVKELGKELVAYVKDNLDTLTPEEYRTWRDKLTGEYNEYSEEYEYDSLDHEFECKRGLLELDKYTAVYRELGVSKTPVVITTVGVLEDTGCPYIETPIIFGKTTWKGSNSIYKCDLSSAAKGVYLEYQQKYEESHKFENSTHSNIRFAKVDGTYVFRDSSPFTEGCLSYTGTLDKAKDLIEGAKNEVHRILSGIVSPQGIDETTASEVLGVLHTMRSSYSHLHLKQSSKVSRASLITTIDGLINKLNTKVDLDMEENTDA